ncbi:GTPase [Proteus vulgaris]|uniref:GTPase n=1 Tax=Proteus vulgaris TaxID=585 RepID=UPI0034D7B40C
MGTNAATLFSLYDQTKTLTLNYPEIAEELSILSKKFDDKRNNPDICIMVYGVYNAGKSTLINALIGEEVAKVADIPKTYRVDKYTWKNNIILDTPGVDAPIDHEEVTKEKMLTADAIIFVVNPSGAAEEQKTFQVMLDILRNGKKLFLVLNDKNDMDEGDLIRLKDHIRARLQQMASERGMDSVLANIPILRVNAKRAFTAKINNRPNQLKASYFEVFEYELNNFINKIDVNHIYKRLSGELNDFLDALISILDKQATRNNTSDIDNLMKEVIKLQHICKRQIANEITCQKDKIYHECKMLLRQDSDNAEQKISSLITRAARAVEQTQQNEMESLIKRFEGDITDLQNTLSYSGIDNKIIAPKKRNDSDNLQMQQTAQNSGLSQIDMISGTVDTLGKIVKPEHIVSGLETVKNLLPSLMKGIGPKTMEKWGAQVVGKWIPYVGPAISVISSLWDMFSDDDSDKQNRDRNEQQRREWERYQQEIEDFSKKTALQFETNALNVVNTSVDEWCEALLSDLNNALRSANEKQQIQQARTIEAQRLKSQLSSLNVV